MSNGFIQSNICYYELSGCVYVSLNLGVIPTVTILIKFVTTPPPQKKKKNFWILNYFLLGSSILSTEENAELFYHAQ